MSFADRDYDVYLVLGDPHAAPLWGWIAWQRLLPDIDPLIKATRGKPSLRSTQFLPGRQTVKFGRLGWKDSDHQKWCHGSPSNEAESKTWNFRNVEIWAPTWSVCEQENRPPDVFLSISNESSDGASQGHLVFNPVVLLAIASELAQIEAVTVRNALSAIARLTAPKLVGYCERPWGKAFGAVGFTNSIQDLPMSGLFKPGPRHTREIGFDGLVDEWQSVGLDGSEQ